MSAGTTVPGSTEYERRAVVYVLVDHINGRLFDPTPKHNAAEVDLRDAYAQDRLAPYPDIRDHYEMRQMHDDERRRSDRAWARDALDAIYSGGIVPGRPRPTMEQVLRMLVAEGPYGANRKEICQAFNRDGGRVSGALTMLHDAGVIVSLPEVKR